MSDVMTELIDVLDENGNKTGEVETKEEIYTILKIQRR